MRKMTVTHQLLVHRWCYIFPCMMSFHCPCFDFSMPPVFGGKKKIVGQLYTIKDKEGCFKLNGSKYTCGKHVKIANLGLDCIESVLRVWATQSQSKTGPTQSLSPGWNQHGV